MDMEVLEVVEDLVVLEVQAYRVVQEVLGVLLVHLDLVDQEHHIHLVDQEVLVVEVVVVVNSTLLDMLEHMMLVHIQLGMLVEVVVAVVVVHNSLVNI